MFVVKFRKIFYTIAIFITVASLYAINSYGLNLGIDFKGGSILEMAYPLKPDVEELKLNVEKMNLGEFSLRAIGENGVIVRTRDLKEPERLDLVKVLNSKVSGEVKRFDSVGPVLGQELQGKSMWSIIAVIIAIVLFITFAFRKVSKPVSSWKYGLVAIVALIHDVLVPTGVFAYLGHYEGVEIDSLFVTALLVVLGFSVHDTIVVFDRVRENLRKSNDRKDQKTFEEVVGKSVGETFTRSINTSLTTLISLAVLYFIGPEATKNFSLALLIGITAGTYSSIFIGSPLLVTLEKFKNRKSK